MAELGAEGASVRELRRQAAALARDQLGDDQQAIELFAQLFEDEPHDAEASAALRALYDKAGRHQDLAAAARTADRSGRHTRERSELRLELADLNVNRFRATDARSTSCRDVLEDEPATVRPSCSSASCYEKAQRDEELAELLSTQIEAAKTAG